MERLQTALLEEDQFLFDRIDVSIPVNEGHGLAEWRGRLWLPESSPIVPDAAHQEGGSHASNRSPECQPIVGDLASSLVHARSRL